MSRITIENNWILVGCSVILMLCMSCGKPDQKVGVGGGKSGGSNAQKDIASGEGSGTCTSKENCQTVNFTVEARGTKTGELLTGVAGQPVDWTIMAVGEGGTALPPGGRIKLAVNNYPSGATTQELAGGKSIAWTPTTAQRASVPMQGIARDVERCEVMTGDKIACNDNKRAFPEYDKQIDINWEVTGTAPVASVAPITPGVIPGVVTPAVPNCPSLLSGLVPGAAAPAYPSTVYPGTVPGYPSTVYPGTVPGYPSTVYPGTYPTYPAAPAVNPLAAIPGVGTNPLGTLVGGLLGGLINKPPGC